MVSNSCDHTPLDFFLSPSDDGWDNTRVNPERVLASIDNVSACETVKDLRWDGAKYVDRDIDRWRDDQENHHPNSSNHVVRPWALVYNDEIKMVFAEGKEMKELESSLGLFKSQISPELLNSMNESKRYDDSHEEEKGDVLCSH